MEQTQGERIFEEMLKNRLPVASLLAFILWLSAPSALSALPIDVCASDDANAAKRLAACGKALSDKKLSDESKRALLSGCDLRRHGKIS